MAVDKCCRGLGGVGWEAFKALKRGKWSCVNKCSTMISFLNLAVTNYCITDLLYDPVVSLSV